MAVSILSGPAYRAWAQPGTPASAPSSPVSAPPSPVSPSRSFEAIGAFGGQNYTIGVNTAGAGAEQRLLGTRMTPSVFRLLRVSPAAGRFFTEADADEGAPPVVVLSHGFWRERFGAAAAGGIGIGGTMMIDGVEHRIMASRLRICVSRTHRRSA